MPEIKDMVSEIKNSFRLISSLKTLKERISDLEYRSIGIIQTKTQKECVEREKPS